MKRATYKTIEQVVKQDESDSITVVKGRLNMLLPKEMEGMKVVVCPVETFKSMAVDAMMLMRWSA